MSALRNVHLVPDQEEDDLYSGYNDPDLDELGDDPEFHRIVSTQYGKRPPILGTTSGKGGRLGTSTGRPLGTSGFRLATGNARVRTGFAAEPGQSRPMTSTRGMGFTSTGGVFDPLNQSAITSGRAPIPPLTSVPEDSPEEAIRQLEKKVNLLLEESAEAGVRGDVQLALDRAKEASRKERMLCKQREQAALTDQINLDLTYCVLFNLADQYQANALYNEALNTYLLIVKNKLFGSGGRLRVNMGNIYFQQKKYPQAIKMYRMALDQIPDTHRDVRLRILQNVCVVYVKMGQYSDAIATYEHIMTEMKEKTDFKTAMNLLLCYYALGDKEKLKRQFQRMVTLSSGLEVDEDRYFVSDDTDVRQRMLVEAIRDDRLRKIEQDEQATAERTLLNAAKLIAPVIENSFANGFDWCIEVVKTSQLPELANELEISKALTYLRQKDTEKAVEVLKDCGRKDSKMASTASTNLSFVFFLEGELTQAERYSEMAIQKDRYNPFALVNRGNCSFAHQQYEKARSYYLEALDVEATCTEALFNLGLTYKKLGQLHAALECFNKLHMIFRSFPEVIYQLADICDRLDDFQQGTEWFMQLISLVPTDPGVLQRMGEIYDGEDRSQAFQYYYESYRYCPTNIDVVSWLGAYYMESQYCDKALQFFDKAALIQPSQVNWQLLVASCYRKIGSYQQALQCYRDIHGRFPDNIDCLKFLVRLSSDMGLAEAQEYALLLSKAEKAAEARRMRAESGGSRTSSGTQGRTGRENSGGVSGLLRTNLPDAGSSTDESRAHLRQVDPTYSDPMGELPERPRTSARPRIDNDPGEFHDAELDDDLLPE